MGILSDDYFEQLKNKQPTPVAAAPSPTPAAPSVQPAPSAVAIPPAAPSAVPVFGKILGQKEFVPSQPSPYRPGLTPGVTPSNETVFQPTFVSPESQIERFGGVVGSPEYYAKKAQGGSLQYLPKQLASTLGIDLPDDETWDKMTFASKAAVLAGASTKAAVRMVTDLPREIVKAPVRAAATIAAPWVSLAKGEQGSLEALAEKPRMQLPWLGEVPTYFQSYDDARKSGMGPLASSLMTIGTALGDVSLVGSLGEAAASAFRPRARLAEGEAIKNVEPIKYTMSQDGVYRPKAAGSVSEYYTLPKTIAKDKYGGGTNNTFMKVTPAGEGMVELSVVQVREGMLPQAIDYVKGKLGPDKRYQGDFGPEVKLESKIIKVGQTDLAAPSTALSTIDEAQGAKIISSIPPKPLKGFENKPINQQQLFTLEQVGKVNGIEPSVRDAVIRTVTGKSVIGDLTQAEYVKAAQTLATFNNLAKYMPEAPGVNMVSQFVAPQRHWMRTYEETSGIPLYSDVYVPLEEGTRLRNVFRDSYRNEAREIFGDYQGAGFAEERRLISAYMRGEKDAITANPSLTPEAKARMIEVSDKMRKLYDRVGPQLDIPTDIFLKDYQPSIQNIGGIYQLYKEGSEIPKQLEFFAKFKRKGNLQGVQIDDALALFDMYINSGSNRMFLNPALERIGSLAEKLPENLKGSVKSYVQEKMGYGGRLEQFLDGFVPNINKRLGIELPPDAARQLTNYTLSTLYSGFLSSPATWFRQTFQYPLFGYARLGPKFAGDAIKKALSKEGMDEVRKSGFIVDLGVPYGEELLKETRAVGRFANAYKNTTQAIIKPNSMADNAMRSIVYHQGKMQFDDAISRYNAGKITWDKLEKELDFSALSPVDRNIIRQRLVEGDIKGAFGNYIREVIDETNFPYRKGASSRIGYGLAGKLGTSLLQWPIEAAHVLKRWTTTGQWDKLIRFYAAGTAIERSMSDTFGFDFARNLSAGGMFGNWWSPFAKTAIDSVNAINNFFQNNKEEFNKNADSIARTLKAGGIPGGVQVQNFQKFFRSYNRGPNAEGQYAVLNNQGEVSYYTDFADLFWGQLMGFPTVQKEAQSRLTKDIKNAQFERGKIKQQILELMQKERFDEATELMADNAISITAADMDDYHIPFNQRNFQQLPAALKAQFAPRVFNNQ